MGKNFETLEIGCWYLNRLGETEQIKWQTSDIYPMLSTFRSYKMGGEYMGEGVEHEFDLVEKVKVIAKRAVKVKKKVKTGQVLYTDGSVGGRIAVTNCRYDRQEFETCPVIPDGIFLGFVEDTIREIELEEEVEEEVCL